jgi:hypothetical protein
MKPQDKRQLLNFTISPKVPREFRKAVPIGSRARFVEDAIKLQLERQARQLVGGF